VGTGVWALWGTEVPQQRPGAEPWWGLGAKPPEARYAHTICSGQTHFRDVFIEVIRCTVNCRLMRSPLPHTTPLKRLFEFVQISRPTLAEVGSCPLVPHCGYATAKDIWRPDTAWNWLRWRAIELFQTEF